MNIKLTEKEATLLCDLIADEQNDGEYEHYWDDEQRELFDEIVYKLKSGFETYGVNEKSRSFKYEGDDNFRLPSPN